MVPLKVLLCKSLGENIRLRLRPGPVETLWYHHRFNKKDAESSQEVDDFTRRCGAEADTDAICFSESRIFRKKKMHVWKYVKRVLLSVRTQNSFPPKTKDRRLGSLFFTVRTSNVRHQPEKRNLLDLLRQPIIIQTKSFIGFASSIRSTLQQQ